MSCIKKNTPLKTKRDEVIWYYWIESMKKSENWSEQTLDKIQLCYECNQELDTKMAWINPCSYEIILDNSIRNVYCKNCFIAWTTDDSKLSKDDSKLTIYNINSSN
jgi:transcription elongation factor Elf1